MTLIKHDINHSIFMIPKLSWNDDHPAMMAALLCSLFIFHLLKVQDQ